MSQKTTSNSISALGVRRDYTKQTKCRPKLTYASQPQVFFGFRGKTTIKSFGIFFFSQEEEEALL